VHSPHASYIYNDRPNEPTSSDIGLIGTEMNKVAFIFFFSIQIVYAQSQDSIITFKHVIPMHEQCITDTDEAGVSCRERYSNAYEAGWWYCIHKFQMNIDCRPEAKDYSISGWPSATYGWAYGFEDAYLRIKYYLKSRKKNEVQLILKHLQIPDTLHYRIKE
jgi:hypothetical protein